MDCHVILKRYSWSPEEEYKLFYFPLSIILLNIATPEDIITPELSLRWTLLVLTSVGRSVQNYGSRYVPVLIIEFVNF